MTTNHMHIDGNWRPVALQSTLKRFEKVAASCGVTRITDITHLDVIGIPTFAALRPGSATVQVANGKGITREAARASALMEAIELHHAETPRRSTWKRCSANQLRSDSHHLISPKQFEEYNGALYSDSRALEWMRGTNLWNEQETWVPASSVHFGCDPSFQDTSSNGLASGNSTSEATLHALYELVERDVVSRLFRGGQIKASALGKAVSFDSIDSELVAPLVELIHRADLQLKLLRVPAPLPVSVFWAIIIDHNASDAMTTVNMGWGANRYGAIAAARAITEAAQTRLAIIHGARENIVEKKAYGKKGAQGTKAFRFFDALPTTESWLHACENAPIEMKTRPTEASLEKMLGVLVEELAEAGYQSLIRVDLNREPERVPVVKVVAPGLLMNMNLFG